MGTFDFTYANKKAVARKGFILIPTHAQEYFGTQAIQVEEYEDYGMFETKDGKFVDVYVVQGIILALAQQEAVKIPVEELYWKTTNYDYDSPQEVYRLKAINELVPLQEYEDFYDKSSAYTTAQFPIKISTKKQNYEDVKTSSFSGQFLWGPKKDIPYPVAHKFETK